MEGFGFPPLEAMACGTPAIVSDRGAIPEVTGGAALIVSPQDKEALSSAMRRVLNDAGLSRQLSDAGRKRARQFTYRESARALGELYQRLL
jgi:glycosyltransferase involved in cell wall biosynthesis